jgi:hypothetical protein
MNGCLTNEVGDVRMMVEEVGAGFRIVVSRTETGAQSEKVIASASAANARAAMTLAEKVASGHRA